ncbi:ABC transporter ATP-binding protein [Zhihengliuella somnathii]
MSVDLGGRTAVHDIDLHVPAGQFLGLLGPNGSGKSTLLRTLYKVNRPSAGQVRVAGDDLLSLTPREAARRVAVLTQEASSDFAMTVDDVVMLGRTPHQGGFGATSGADRQIAAEALDLVNASQLASREFSTLSGGEKQRVLLARAFAQQTPVLVLDEPTNHLDIHYQLELLELVATRGVTVIAALHDVNLAAQFCDHIAVMVGGRLVAQGTADEVVSPEVIDPAFRVVSDQFPNPHAGHPVISFRRPGSEHLTPHTSP